MIAVRDIHTFEPIWENWAIDEEIAKGSYGTVWIAHREDKISHVRQYAAVKHISIPGQEDVDQGDIPLPDAETNLQYYRLVLNCLTTEIDAVLRLQRIPNIVSYEEYKVESREQGGFDFFLRMELLKNVPSFIKMRGKALTQNEVIKLGIDITTALENLPNQPYIHRNIKPENLFIDMEGNFKLGDLGTAIIHEVSTARGVQTNMAPEVYLKSGSKCSDHDQTDDVYSLGMVMYRYMNNGYPPFVSMEQIDMLEAFVKRMKGEPMPPPCEADIELTRIILKACAYKPEERYKNVSDFKQALQKVSR